MKALYFLAASAAVLTLGACSNKAPAARAALDCPATQGDLTRTSASPDGKACTYSTSGGAEVTLQLVSLQGGPDGTLSAIETNLLANRVAPAPDAKDGKDAKGAKTGDAEDAATKAEDLPKAGKAAESAADKAASEAHADAAVSIHANIDEKGKLDVVTENGGETRVNLPGIHIVANDRDDTAKVKVGPITVDAGGDGATVRMRRDVRLRGEALNPKKNGLRAMFIYTGDDLPEGYRFVGYEAGGPKSGPLTVAIVKSKSDGPNGGDIYPDVKKLVRKNGGV